LKTVYVNSPISADSKWPPTPSKEFINLVLIGEDGECREDYIGHVLEGNVEQVERTRISLGSVLEPRNHESWLKLVLVEGAPGIGKSTLAWELCRKWEEFSCMEASNSAEA
jgi:predicted kinase